MALRRDNFALTGWSWLLAAALAAACSPPSRRAGAAQPDLANAPGGGAATAVAASAAAGTGATSDPPSNGEDTSTEHETDNADKPQQVSGAFLTGIGPAPEYPAPAGMESYGAGMFDPTSHVKYLGSMISPTVTLTTKGGQTVQPTLVAAPAASSWNVYFQLPVGEAARYVSGDFTASTSPNNGPMGGPPGGTGTSTGNEQSASTLTATPTSSFGFQPAPLSASDAQQAQQAQVL